MTPDEIQALAHAEVARVLTELAFMCWLSDPEMMPAAFKAACDKYGVELATGEHCETCHGIDGCESWCSVPEFNAAMNAADAAIDRWRERELDAGGEIWEIDE